MMVDAHLYPPESGAFAFLSQEQWGPLPWWVMLELHHLARNGRHEAARLFFAHYELWALTVNSYSSVTHGNLLSGVSLDTAFFHSLPPEHLRSPMFSSFPLLPLSHDYALPAALQALEALKVLISLRMRYENPQEQKRLKRIVDEADLAYLDWQHMWSTYPLARRQDLSRSLWNTFALVMEGHKIPSVNTVFITATAPMASVGAARPFRLSNEQEHLFPTLAKDAHQGQKAFEDTVVRICKYLVEHYPHAVTWIIPAHRSLPEDYYVAGLQHLHALGGIAALSVDKRFRLLVELFLAITTC